MLSCLRTDAIQKWTGFVIAQMEAVGSVFLWEIARATLGRPESMVIK
jgi:hypothetical protein